MREQFQDLPYGFVVQSQLALLSDRCYLEQYFKNEFDNDVNQNIYLSVKQQEDDWAWTAYGNVRQRRWG